MHIDCAHGFDEKLLENCDISSQVSNSTAASIGSHEELKEPVMFIDTSKKSSASQKPPVKLDQFVDESDLMNLALKLSEDLNLGSYEQCYYALQAAQGNESLAVEYLLK